MSDGTFHLTITSPSSSVTVGGAISEVTFSGAVSFPTDSDDSPGFPSEEETVATVEAFKLPFAWDTPDIDGIGVPICDLQNGDYFVWGEVVSSHFNGSNPALFIGDGSLAPAEAPYQPDLSVADFVYSGTAIRNMAQYIGGNGSARAESDFTLTAWVLNVVDETPSGATQGAGEVIVIRYRPV